MLDMIRGIIFDCFGVLYGGSLTALYEMAPDENKQALLDLNKQADYGFISQKEYFDGLAELTGRTYEEIDGLIHQKHARHQEVFDYLYDLKKRGKYKIGMLSNVGEVTIQQLFTEDELTNVFDAVVLSYQENLAKPNPEVFKLMATRIGLVPEECVMIDDLEPNCDGAEIAGMQSIWHINARDTKTKLEAMLDA